jgi:casein kinase II subunit alpha
VFEGCNIKNN